MNNPYVETFSGRKFFAFENPEHPDLTSICVDDIATSLSRQCRFTGHSKKFYSVAEHSVGVASLVRATLTDRGWAGEKLTRAVIAALLHDASEAYLSDINSPFKSLLQEYKSLEGAIQGRIYARFGMPVDQELRGIIYSADIGILMWEANYLMPTGGKDWGITTEYDTQYIENALWERGGPRCLWPDPAKDRFLSMWERSHYQLRSSTR